MSTLSSLDMLVCLLIRKFQPSELGEIFGSRNLPPSLSNAVAILLFTAAILLFTAAVLLFMAAVLLFMAAVSLFTCYGLTKDSKQNMKEGPAKT